MKKMLFLLLVLSAGVTFGQSYSEDNILDSLQKELSKDNIEDTTYINLLLNIGEKTPIFRVSYWDSIATFAERIIRERPTTSKLYHLNFSLAKSLNNIGYIFKKQGDILNALTYYHRSLKISEEIGDMQGLANSFNNIGVIYNQQGDVPNALTFYQKSLTIKEELGDKRGIATSLNNIGMVYYNQEDIAKCLEYYLKSLAIREEIGNKKRIATALNNIGSVYDKQGDIPKALTYYQKSLTIKEELGDKQGMANSLSNIGTLQLEKGELFKAKKNVIRSMELAKEIGYPRQIMATSSTLKQIAIKEGNFKEALKMYELHIQMRDSINNEKTQKATIRQQTKYEFEKQKTIDDAKHDKLIAVSAEQERKQQIISYSVAGGLALVVLFSLFVMNRLRVTRRQKTTIEKQKEEVEQQRDKIKTVQHETLHQKQIIEEAHKEITDSINYAERIQRSFLASKDLLNENLDEYFVLFKPKDVVSGDFYWADKLSNGNFAIVNADSTGHGVPGAIMSILNISSIEGAIKEGELKPQEIFNKTRKSIIERLKNDGSEEGGHDGMDASILCFNAAKTKMTYTAAQNPIWVIRESNLIEIAPEKMAVGKHDKDQIPFVGGEFDLQKGDQVYTLTDGFQDQFGGPKGKKFMVKKMREYVLSISHFSMEEQHQKLSEVFANWRGDAEQVDDVCVIGVKI
jgi:serine phosphatase RsbU (regulator of sigma subunit)